MARAGLLDVPRDEPRQGAAAGALRLYLQPQFRRPAGAGVADASVVARHGGGGGGDGPSCRCTRSEEHTSELQSLMRISYAVFCLKKKKLKYHLYNMT